jgi:hypothetical protein
MTVIQYIRLQALIVLAALPAQQQQPGVLLHGHYLPIERQQLAPHRLITSAALQSNAGQSSNGNSSHKVSDEPWTLVMGMLCTATGQSPDPMRAGRVRQLPERKNIIMGLACVTPATFLTAHTNASMMLPF